MSHLSTDRLAAVVDDSPTAEEATHLAGCWDCRAEVAAYRRLARMAAMAPVPMEPLTAWSQLAPQLRAAGLISQSAPVHVGGATPVDAARVLPFMRPARSPMRVAMRAAAGLALLIGGAALGRYTAAPAPSSSTGEPPMFAVSPTFSSNEEAEQVLASAQQQYQAAAAFLAAQGPSSSSLGMNRDAYQTRLAALDEIAAAARAALYRTPQDPMLNQYYLTTLGAREATLRQIGATSPDSRRLERY